MPKCLTIVDLQMDLSRMHVFKDSLIRYNLNVTHLCWPLEILRILHLSWIITQNTSSSWELGWMGSAMCKINDLVPQYLSITSYNIQRAQVT
jgi:hypothetical protein